MLLLLKLNPGVVLEKGKETSPQPASDQSKREDREGENRLLVGKRRALVLLESRSNSSNLAVSPACLSHSQTHFAAPPSAPAPSASAPWVSPVLAHPASQPDRRAEAEGLPLSSLTHTHTPPADGTMTLTCNIRWTKKTNQKTKQYCLGPFPSQYLNCDKL